MPDLTNGLLFARLLARARILWLLPRKPSRNGVGQRATQSGDGPVRVAFPRREGVLSINDDRSKLTRDRER